MAVLYIAEYDKMGIIRGQQTAIALEPPVAEQTVSIAGSSAQSSAFNAATRYVRLHTDAICSVLFGTDPTATAAKKRMAANQTEYFAVPAGGTHKVAVITNS